MLARAMCTEEPESLSSSLSPRGQRGYVAGSLRHAPYTMPYARTGPPLDTPPPSSSRPSFLPEVADTSPVRAPVLTESTSPSGLMNTVSDLKLSKEVRVQSVLIACDPTHPKYAKLRRLVKVFRDREETLADYVAALVQAP